MTDSSKINIMGIKDDELFRGAVYAIAQNHVIEHINAECTAYEIELARTPDGRGRLYVLVGGDEAPVYRLQAELPIERQTASQRTTERTISEAKAAEVFAKIGK